MVHFDSDDAEARLMVARRNARASGYVHHAQVMLVAAGIAAFGIVAVAATMMTTLF